MDKFADMAMFVSVVKHQGLASAGRELGLSPATMTSRLQSLEQRYGVKLINRSTRHIALTESGEIYYKACLDILESVSETENVLLNRVKEVKGIIKISAPTDIGKQYIEKIVADFAKIYPDVIPYLYLNDDISNIAESEVDIAIRYGALLDSSLISRRLALSHRVLCASPEYLEEHGTPMTPHDLLEHDCLALIRMNEELKTWHFQDNGIKNSVTITPKRFSDDGEVIRHWALDSGGIALKSKLDVQSDIDNHRLVTVLDHYMKNFNTSTLSNSSDLNVVYTNRKYQPKRFKLFLAHLFEHFPNSTSKANIQ